MSGEIVFPADAPPFEGANVSLLETNLADAPAIVLKELRIPNVSYDPAKPTSVTFKLDVSHLPSVQLRTCSINVLVDLDQDDKVSSGDLINTAAYPVDLRTPFSQLSIKVNLIE